MSTRPMSPKDKRPKKPDSKGTFLDLAAIDEKSLADGARKVVANLKREGKLPPRTTYDPKELEEDNRMLSRLFGDHTSKRK